ncbi:uncharacterized protein [Elaeis guineensis]|uniref:Uncharacterized protein LOC105060558 n=1 Tax=Elaeis guineensis var. tenera TaxID=51953 RepID=A0A6I9SN45_ELAGV|nr:uncharacterized protein LOC105060558 [Elaeis guineensis]
MAHSLIPAKPPHLTLPSSSCPKVAPQHLFVKFSASPRRRSISVARVMQSSGVDGTKSSKEDPKETNSNAAPVQPSGRGLPLPNIPIWARWVLGSIVCLALPFYKRILRIEDGVEKAAETILKTVEKVAEITEEIASDVADVLPGDGRLKEEVLKIENIADQIDKDAEKAEAFLHKVDQIEEEVGALVEPIIEKGELIGKENQAEKEAEEREIPTDKEANPSTAQSKDTGETSDK